MKVLTYNAKDVIKLATSKRIVYLNDYNRTFEGDLMVITFEKKIIKKTIEIRDEGR